MAQCITTVADMEVKIFITLKVKTLKKLKDTVQCSHCSPHIVLHKDEKNHNHSIEVKFLSTHIGHDKLSWRPEIFTISYSGYSTTIATNLFTWKKIEVLPTLVTLLPVPYLYLLSAYNALLTKIPNPTSWEPLPIVAISKMDTTAPQT